MANAKLAAEFTVALMMLGSRTMVVIVQQVISVQ